MNKKVSLKWTHFHMYFLIWTTLSKPTMTGLEILLFFLPVLFSPVCILVFWFVPLGVVKHRMFCAHVAHAIVSVVYFYVITGMWVIALVVVVGHAIGLLCYREVFGCSKPEPVHHRLESVRVANPAARDRLWRALETRAWLESWERPRMKRER